MKSLQKFLLAGVMLMFLMGAGTIDDPDTMYKTQTVRIAFDNLWQDRQIAKVELTIYKLDDSVAKTVVVTNPAALPKTAAKFEIPMYTISLNMSNSKYYCTITVTDEFDNVSEASDRHYYDKFWTSSLAKPSGISIVR